MTDIKWSEHKCFRHIWVEVEEDIKGDKKHCKMCGMKYTDYFKSMRNTGAVW